MSHKLKQTNTANKGRDYGEWHYIIVAFSLCCLFNHFGFYFILISSYIIIFFLFFHITEQILHANTFNFSLFFMRSRILFSLLSSSSINDTLFVFRYDVFLEHHFIFSLHLKNRRWWICVDWVGWLAWGCCTACGNTELHQGIVDLCNNLTMSILGWITTFRFDLTLNPEVSLTQSIN